jgi:hypothetical protein
VAAGGDRDEMGVGDPGSCDRYVLVRRETVVGGVDEKSRYRDVLEWERVRRGLGHADPVQRV